MVCEELATVLETAGLENVYRYILPDRPASAVAVIEYPGRSGEQVFGTAGIAREYPRVQVLIRGEKDDTVEPRTRAEAAYVALGAVQNTTLGLTFYFCVTPLQPPFSLGRDDNGCWVYAFNCEAWKEPSTT